MFNLIITAYHPGRKTWMKTSEFINGNWEKYTKKLLEQAM